MMNANFKAFMLTTILIASVSTAPAFGQISNSITVTADKAAYSEGETILITGEVSQPRSGAPVALVIYAPNGNIVAVDQIDIDENKKFKTEVIAGGSLMTFEGAYTIKVTYGDRNHTTTSETTFELSGLTDTPPDDSPDMYPVVIDESEYSLEYSITGGNIVSMMPNMDDKSIIINIDATNEGSLTITLPRSVIDALADDKDINFLVLVDNEESDDVMETKKSSYRILTITFPAGTEQIEIIGTWIVPEFGTIAVMILVVAIVSIIAISARSRLSIIPRY